MDRVKKVLWWIFIAFLIYAVFTSPDQAAGIIRTVIDIIVAAFNSLLRFFDALLASR